MLILGRLILSVGFVLLSIPGWLVMGDSFDHDTPAPVVLFINGALFVVFCLGYAIVVWFYSVPK